MTTLLKKAYQLLWTAIVFLVPLFAAMFAEIEIYSMGPMSETLQVAYFGPLWFMYIFTLYIPLALLCPKSK